MINASKCLNVSLFCEMLKKKIYLKNLATNLCNRSLTGLDEEVSCSEKMHACHIVAKHFFLAGDDYIYIYIYIYLNCF